MEFVSFKIIDSSKVLPVGRGRSSNKACRAASKVLASLAIVGVSVVFTTSQALAQKSDSASQKQSSQLAPGLTVTSNPGGALVELKGAARLAGLSPVFFSQGIPGRYELRVSKAGYETYRTTVIISVDRVEQVDVRLDAKTRGKAAIRSLLIPGWGQYYAGKKTKGSLMTIAALASGVAAVLAEADYQDKRDEFDLVNAALSNAEAHDLEATLPSLRVRKAAAQANAHDAETLRRAAIGGAIAIWGVSFLDALFFFPSFDGHITVKNITITPESDVINGYAGFKFSAGF